MFEKIIGNDNIKELLVNSIKSNRISHSYLFIGIDGIGKQLIAKDFAKMILCLNKDENCNNCKSCLEFNSNNNPDFLLIEPDGNSIKIEQIRNLQKKIQERPIISDRKVYVINDANLMTTEAQNCLLKTLEEPPDFATIILIGSNGSSFLSTVKSRCTIINFKNIENKQIKEYMKKEYNIEDISQNMLEIFQGSIKKAILLKNKYEQYQTIEDIFNNINKKDIIDIFGMSEMLYKSKEEIFEVLDYINVIFLKLAKQDYRYTNCIKIVENTRIRLKRNANYDMCIDYMLLNIWGEMN